MSNNTKVLIGGEVYKLSSDKSEEYMQKVALYVNKKMEDVFESLDKIRFNNKKKYTLLAINMADDYFTVKNENDILKKEKEDFEKIKNQLFEENERLKKELKEYIELFDNN